MLHKTLISEMISVQVPGANLKVLLRGKKERNPLLLILPQGPGFPGIASANRIEKTLHIEDHFTVAYLDPRGCGLSFNRSTPADSFSISQYTDDVVCVIRALEKYRAKQGINVLGFSIGGSIAMLAALTIPEEITKVIAVGPDISFPEAENYAYEFALREATSCNNKKATRKLIAIGNPPHTTTKQFQTRVKWVIQFGGIQRDENFNSLIRQSLWDILACEAYTMADKLRGLRGINFTQERMLPRMSNFDLRQRIKEFPVPLIIAQGALDKAAPPELAKQFYDSLSAPRGKKFIHFANSAHNPHFEEPEKFREMLLEK